ncbi:MAG: hypothetical protein P4L83_00530 [Nevskia sp.]|nr:hypothetical protein [Nevskia sp.]
MNSLIEDAASAAGKLAGGVLSGALPWLLGTLGAAILALGAVVFVDHHWTIPTLRANLKAAGADLAVANGQTSAANQQVEALRRDIDAQNRKLTALQDSLAAAGRRADAAGVAAVRKPLPPPPAGLDWNSVRGYLQSLRRAP